MRSRIGLAVLAAGAATVTLAGCGVGAGAETDGFYAGETVDLVVPYDPGGGYDIYARAIAPFLGQCLDAKVVVRNEPGAGGLVATNATAVTDSDERRLEILNMAGFAAAQIAGADGVQFDLEKLSYAGRITTAPNSVSVSGESPISDFDDLVNAETPVRFVATGPGSEGYITAVGLAAAYGFPVDVVTGFAGSEEARTAVVAGDADVEALVYDSQLSAIEAGDIRPLVMVSDEPVEQLPDTPLITDYSADSEEAQSVVDSLVALGMSGRAIAGPPGLSESQLEELRTGFQCAMDTDKLLEQLADQGRPVSFAPGDEVAEHVSELLDATPEFTRAIKAAF